MGDDQSSMLYHGSCHCGALQFTAVKKGTPDKVMECNCSYCSKTGFQYASSLPVGEIRWTSDGDSYTDYQFPPKTMKHRFCSICGSSVAIVKNDGTIATVNARMIKEIEPKTFPVKVHNGAEQGGYDHPAPKAPEPQPDGTTLYYGSCHCRAVTYTVQRTPITSANECNCSICWRNADLWVYNLKPEFNKSKPGFELLTGKESLSKYQFNTMVASHMTCKICGINLFNFLPETAPLAPINARTLEGVDLSKIDRKPQELEIQMPDGSIKKGTMGDNRNI